MIYLDYSATTPVNRTVLDKFIGDCDKDFDIKELESEKEKVKKIFNTDLDVVYTSCSTESNNLAIKGIARKYPEKGRRIITTSLEHSSVSSPLKYLEAKGFIIDLVKLNNGVVDLFDLENLITKDTILITITGVNSETGVLQPINEIGELARKHNIPFHCDLTQAIGKINIDFKNIDLASMSSHKFYGLKGVGVLLVKKDIELIPLFFGERTYNIPLIKSLTNALELSLNNLDDKYKHVEYLNNKIRNSLKDNQNIHINSTNSIPHILNISIKNTKPETFQHLLEQDNIYISTDSACSSSNDISKSVLSVTNNEDLAKTSVRISLSYLTTEEEINKLIYSIKKYGGNL